MNNILAQVHAFALLMPLMYAHIVWVRLSSSPHSSQPVSLMTVVEAKESSVRSVQKDRGSWMICGQSQVPATTAYSQFGSTSVEN